ncbi:6-phosphogluconolactonase [Mariprofundus erugo]|uniref:6-phosphogluconolactonase n=1 Tax=Mariprofundus erugo TaxID=2528639 RepID=UPI0010FF114B|nr:6-phosphogluconolactonase [Mariprofundus erugo]TLS76545.1 6-phosphogluconolactonase [Mariprofundus erugo]
MSEMLFESPAELAAYAAGRVAELCQKAVAEKGGCHLVLAGGTTPRLCYELLRQMPLPWASLHIWFGDERCLPVGDAERNDTMADAALLRHVPIPAAQIHRMSAEEGPESAAAAYAALLAAAPVMDIVLLGMGEDGHTASLFPANPALTDVRLAVPVYNSPKPPAERVSMGYTALNAARHRILMVTGKGKADALARIRAGERLPIAAIADGEWLMDRAAMGSTD